MTDIPAGHMLARRLAVVVAGVLVLMIADWVLLDPRANLTTDWTAFDNAADRVVSGEVVYRPYSAEAEPLPYLYPPFALVLALPLAAFGFFGSFAVSAIAPFVAFVSGLRLFGRAEPGDVDRTTGLVVGIASGAAIGSSLIGQYSGLYVLAFGAATLLYTRDRRGLAGIALALLWLKPNIAIAVPVVLVWARSWRTMRGFCGGTVGVLLMSLPLGLDQWSGFVSNAQMMVDLQEQGIVPFDKMVTFLGGVQTIVGFAPDSITALVVWLSAAVVLGLSTLALWTPTALEESPVRAFGALALFVIAANPRMYFYDAALVVLGMFGLWMNAHVRGGALARRWTPALSVLIWFALWGNVFASLNRFVGPFVAVALVVTAVDSRQSAAALVIEASFDASESTATDAVAA